MQQKAVSLFLCYLLLYTCGGVEAGTRKNSKKSKDSGSGFWSTLTYMAVGGGGSAWRRARKAGRTPAASARSLPLLPPGLLAAGLPALGFTGAGIAANSVAASLMSWSAVANGGGVPAGGLVATLQSLGASGGSTLMAKVGAFLGYAVHNQMQNNGADEEEE
uniref:Interferon alpha inducible protein 6 n=1 Tax=Rhinolophus ferrumequinum TaxID=59479 RepID=A0A671EBJ7_RHIFE